MFTELSNGFATCGDPDGLQAICDRLGPGTIEVFFERWMSQLYKTRVVTRDTTLATVNAFYRDSWIKQYLKDGRALRVETVIDKPDDIGCLRRLVHPDDCKPRVVPSAAVYSILNESGRFASLRAPAFERVAQSTVTDDGRR